MAKAFTRKQTKARTRTESDTFGPIEVPADRYWGAQTQRSIENFRIGTERIPLPLIRALGIVKRASAEVNYSLKLLEARRRDAIVKAAQEVIDGHGDSQLLGVDANAPAAKWASARKPVHNIGGVCRARRGGGFCCQVPPDPA